jgi:zinc/manganese transport system permease protein
MSDLAILLPAFVGGILMMAVHVPLGREVLVRGIIFADLCLAQLAALGAVLAQMLGAGFFATQAGALGFAMLGGFMLMRLEKRHVSLEKKLVAQAGSGMPALMSGNSPALLLGGPDGKSLTARPNYDKGAPGGASLPRETRENIHLAVGSSLLRWNGVMIGCSFILSTSLVFLVLSGRPHGGEHIDALLSGQLLLAGWGKIAFAGAISMVAAACVRLRPSVFLGKYFYPLFATVVTASVQLCGVYLVFALLIFPAVGACRIADKSRCALWEYLGEACGLALGLLASFYFDLPSGPAMVWGIALAMGGVFAASGIRDRSGGASRSAECPGQE